MKTKRKQFVQHLAHEIEDENKVWDYLDETLPTVGYIVLSFNGLEKDLDHLLCRTFSDRSDTPGLIVLQNMQYAAKVNLFSRFCDDFHATLGKTPKPYAKLVDSLRETAKQRNIVVHADWESTDKDGYTYSNLRFSDGGMNQEYVQLNAAALDSIINKILDVRTQLGDYWKERENLLTVSRD